MITKLDRLGRSLEPRQDVAAGVGCGPALAPRRNAGAGVGSSPRRAAGGLLRLVGQVRGVGHVILDPIHKVATTSSGMPTNHATRPSGMGP